MCSSNAAASFDKHGLDRHGKRIFRVAHPQRSGSRRGAIGRRTGGRCCPGPPGPGPRSLRPSSVAIFSWALACAVADIAHARHDGHRRQQHAGCTASRPATARLRRAQRHRRSAADVRRARIGTVFEKTLQVPGQVAGRRVAIARLAGHGLQHDGLQVAGNRRVELPRARAARRA